MKLKLHERHNISNPHLAYYKQTEDGKAADSVSTELNARFPWDIYGPDKTFVLYTAGKNTATYPGIWLKNPKGGTEAIYFPFGDGFPFVVNKQECLERFIGAIVLWHIRRGNDKAEKGFGKVREWAKVIRRHIAKSTLPYYK